MFDLCWTIPVARWSYWPAGAQKPGLPFLEPMVRRRLSALSKMALHVAHACVAEREAVRVVFASRHGELRRTGEILDSIAADEPVSPTAFSLSVLNAMTGVFGIARGDRCPATAISAGPETLGYALLEAYSQYRADPSTPVLLVYADEPVDARYGPVDDEVAAGALAVLLDDGEDGAECRLECTVTAAASDTGAEAIFPTQSEAVLHGLREARQARAGKGAACAWRAGAGGRRWRWIACEGAR